MADWIGGELKELQISWMRAEGECEIRADRELVRVVVSGVTAGTGGAFDNYLLSLDLTDEKIAGNEMSYVLIGEVPAGSAAEIPVFGAVKDVQVAAAHLVPKEAVAGNDTDYMVLKMVNKETGAVICTKTFLGGVQSPAFQVVDFGPADEAAGQIARGWGVALVKEEVGAGMKLPFSVLAIEWNLR